MRLAMEHGDLLILGRLARKLLAYPEVLRGVDGVTEADAWYIYLTPALQLADAPHPPAQGNILLAECLLPDGQTQWSVRQACDAGLAVALTLRYLLSGCIVKGLPVVLKRPVDRFPHFVAPAGLTGVVDEVSNGPVTGKRGLISVLLDQPLAGAESWGNTIVWTDDQLASVEDDLGLTLPADFA